MTPTALVVEDDADLMLLAVEWLAQLGWKAREATSLASGIAALSGDHAIDVVLLDLRIGAEDGASVLEWLRVTRGASAPPVIMVSANADPDAVKRSARLGARAYVRKPYTRDQLAEALARATHPGGDARGRPRR